MVRNCITTYFLKNLYKQCQEDPVIIEAVEVDAAVPEEVGRLQQVSHRWFKRKY
jgi:hypothetical protein